MLDDGFEKRRHELVGRHAAFLQAVDVRLRENPAFAGYRMQFQAHIAHVAKVLGGDSQLGVNLVDDRARTPRALVVHGGDFLFSAGLRIFLEDDDLGVLATQFDDRAAFRVKFLYSERNRVHFLYEFRPNVLADGAASAPRNKYPGFARLDAGLGFHAIQELKALFRLLRVVALVVTPDDLVRGGIYHNGLHRGRADVETDYHVLGIDLVHFTPFPCAVRFFASRPYEMTRTAAAKRPPSFPSLW